MSGVWQGSNIKVWYKLADAQQPTKVCVDASFDIDDLKKVIKNDHSISLSHCDASRLLIFPHIQSYVADGNSTGSSGQVKSKVLDPDESIPPTTSKKPLIVMIPLLMPKLSLNQTQLKRNDKNTTFLRTGSIDNLGGQECSSEVESPMPLNSEINLPQDEVQPIGLGDFTRDNCDKNEIDNNNNIGQNLLMKSNKKEDQTNKVMKQEMSSDEGNEDDTLVTHNSSIKLEWNRMKKRKKIRKKKKREVEEIEMMVKKKLSNLAAKRSNYLCGNMYEDNDTVLDQNNKEMNDKMQEREADTSSESKEKIVNMKISKKELKKGAISFEGLVSLGDNRNNGSEYVQEKNSPNTQFCKNTNKTDEEKQEEKEVALATKEIAYVRLHRKIRSPGSDDHKDSRPVMSQDQFTVFNKNEKKVHKSKKSRREKTVESIGASPMLDIDRMSRTTPSPRLKKGHIRKLKCLQVTDEKDKSKKKRLNEDTLEQEYIDETLRRARIEFTANIKKRRREDNTFVRRGTEMKNAACHICHKRRPLGYQFVCRINTHIYCEKHCLDRLGFDLSSQKITYKCCPICSLQCTCAKCQRQVYSVASLFKKQCHQQGLGLDETHMEVLQLCSPKLESMRSNDGNNVDNNKDYVTRIAHKKTHMTGSGSTHVVQNNFPRKIINQLKVADSINLMGKNCASNEIEKHVYEPHRKIQSNRVSKSPPIPKRRRREYAKTQQKQKHIANEDSNDKNCMTKDNPSVKNGLESETIPVISKASRIMCNASPTNNASSNTLVTNVNYCLPHRYRVLDQVLITKTPDDCIPQRKFGDPVTEGPYHITRINHNGTVQIRRGATLEIISIRRIKPFHSAA